MTHVQGGRNTATPLLNQAAQQLTEGNLAQARELYQAVLQERTCPQHTGFADHNVRTATYKSEGRALAGLARCALLEKNVKAATELVAVIRKSFADSLESDDVRQAVSAVDLAAGGSAVSGGIKDLEDAVKKNPTDLEARYSLASALFASGAHSRAIEEALELLKKDKAWKEQAAKTLLLKIFEVRRLFVSGSDGSPA